MCIPPAQAPPRPPALALFGRGSSTPPLYAQARAATSKDALAALLSSFPTGGGVVNRAGLYQLRTPTSIGRRGTGLALAGFGQEMGPEAPSTSSILDIQRLLSDKGWFTGAQDGILGPETTQAIRTFQAAAGLDANGIPDSGTVAALLSAPSRGGPTPRAALAVAPTSTGASGASPAGGFSLPGISLKTVGIGLAVVAVGLLFLGRK
jgi:hypothetical protein